ncbi:uncharacterized protein [Branchiostoma lanceolatum]|uniref:uncharacterized protein n=1 Tax=Branchiostoma lanceolatum TaxID=7740 RepID=UPI003454E777
MMSSVDNYFHIIVENARDRWKEIGRRLGLSETDISAIDQEERGDTTEGCRKVLDKWRQMYGKDATVDVLKHAFTELERRDIVDLLEVLNQDISETPESRLRFAAAAAPVEEVSSGTAPEQVDITQSRAEWEAEHQESALPVLLYVDTDAPGDNDQPPSPSTSAASACADFGSSENELKDQKIKRLKKRTEAHLKMLRKVKDHGLMSKKDVQRKCKKYIRRYERKYARIERVEDGCVLLYLTFDLISYLYEFWEDYTSGALSGELTGALVTDEMRAVVGQDVFVRVIILKRDYRRWERYLENKEKAVDAQKADTRSSVPGHTLRTATTPLHRLVFKISQELIITDEDVQTVKDKIRLDHGEEKMAPYENLIDLTDIIKQLEADDLLGSDEDKVTNTLKLFEGVENFDRRHFELDIENAGENIDFVGREKEMKSVINRISTDGGDTHVKIIGLNGLAGVGKTTFAHQLCLEQGRREIFISLAKVSSVDNMLPLIMREFGFTEINGDGNTEVEAMAAHLIGTYGGEDCCLVLDDADGLLEVDESRRKFVSFLAKVRDKQNSKVHVIVTSRLSIVSGPGLGDVPSMKATTVDLEMLADSDGTDLVQRLVGKGNITKEDAREVCKRCNGWPLAIRIACGVIRKDRLQPSEMIKRLGNLTEMGDIRGFLTEVVSTLSRDLLATLKLMSVFAGPFTVESACIIIGQREQLLQVWGHLRELRTRSLIKAGSRSNDGEPRYDTHDVVRTFVSTFNTDAVTVQEMAAAKYRFKKLYEERLTTVAQNLQSNIQQALATYNNDVGNFNHFLTLVQCETHDDYEWRRKERDDSHTWLMDIKAEEVADRSVVHILLEQMMVVKDRIAFYTGQTKQLEKQNKQIYAEMLCWLAEALLQVNTQEEAWDGLEEARKALEARPDRGDESVQLSFARYHYVSGIYFSLRDDYKRNVRHLEQALEIMSKVKIAGNHVLHARVVNSLGFAHHNHAKNMWRRGQAYFAMLQNSLERHQEAHDIITKAVGQGNHFDCATYLMNIGVVYLDMGWYYKGTAEVRQYFDKALETFENAEKLVKRMHLEKQHNYGLLQYNFARCYEALGRLDKATSRVQEAQKVLESIYESHPDIADCLYFIGKLSEKDPTSAMKYYKQSLEHNERLGSRRNAYEWKRLQKAILELCSKDKNLKKEKDGYLQQFERIDGTPYTEPFTVALAGYGRGMVARLLRPIYTFISDVMKAE